MNNLDHIIRLAVHAENVFQKAVKRLISDIETGGFYQALTQIDDLASPEIVEEVERRYATGEMSEELVNLVMRAIVQADASRDVVGDDLTDEQVADFQASVEAHIRGQS